MKYTKNPLNPFRKNYIYRKVIEYILDQGWVIDYQGFTNEQWVTLFTPVNHKGKPLYDNIIFMYSIGDNKLHRVLAANQITDTAILNHQFSTLDKFEFLLNTFMNTPEQFPLPGYVTMKL